MAWVVNDSGDAWTVKGSLDLTPAVKNTFLTLMGSYQEACPRSSSVPASCRLCKDSTSVGKFTKDNLDLDVSTQDGSMCSESGSGTPSNSGDGYLARHLSSDGAPQNSLCKSAGVHQQSSSEVSRSRVRGTRGHKRVGQGNGGMKSLQDHLIDAINSLKDALLSIQSEHIANVEVHEDAGTYSVIIQLAAGQGDRSSIIDDLLALAQEMFLEVVAESRKIFIMGYCSPQPFFMEPQGFEATLAAMSNPVDACWHMFKKGFCRHGDACCKKHPVFQIPVHVFVEGVQLNSCASFADSFKQEVGYVITEVGATLGQCCHVEGFKDKDGESWTIEVTSTQGVAMHKDDILTLAKNALYKATLASHTVCIIGYAAKPFRPKDRGFATLLGDMQDESTQCWDFYSKGGCKYGHTCKWSHPECLIPINVVVRVHDDSPLSAV